MKVKDYQRTPLIKDVRLGIILIIVIVFTFAFYLIRVPSGLGFTLSAFFALLIFIAPCILIANPTLIKILQKDYENNPKRVWIFPLFLFVFSMLYAFITGKSDGLCILTGALYCFVPFLLVIPLKNRSPVLTIWDVILVLFLWLPVEFGFVTELGIPHVQSVVNLYILIGLNISLYVYLIIRQLPDIGYTFRLKDHEWRTAIMNFLILLVIVVLIGFVTDFIKVSRSMPSFGVMVQKFLFICFFIAIPEEILFRGIIHNLIEKRLAGIKRGTIIALIISSIIFGLAHGNKTNPPFIDLSLGALGIWHVPWAYILLATIAGIFYGLTFIKTRKIFAAAMVHLLIDWVWFVVFSG